MEEVTEAIQSHPKFFQKIERDDFITFDYNNVDNPMLEYRKVFKDPFASSDPNVQRQLQILRYIHPPTQF